MRPTRHTKTTCCYCGVIIESDGAQVLGVRGDPEHPANSGLLCSKGSTLHLSARPVAAWAACCCRRTRLRTAASRLAGSSAIAATSPRRKLRRRRRPCRLPESGAWPHCSGN